MPEGPTILMMAEEAAKFVGRPVREASGNAKLAYSRLLRRKPIAIRSFGKQFLVDFGTFYLRAHLLLFGSYRIDETREKPPRLALRFANGELNIYGGSVRLVDGALADDYDWRIDVLSDDWDPARARRTLRARPDTLACDILMDQNVFAGVGNIIKNEVLHRIGVHPAARLDELSAPKRAALVKDAREFSFQVLAWRRRNVLRKHLRVHKRKYCADCGTELPAPARGRGPGTRDRRAVRRELVDEGGSRRGAGEEGGAARHEEGREGHAGEGGEARDEEGGAGRTEAAREDGAKREPSLIGKGKRPLSDAVLMGDGGCWRP